MRAAPKLDALKPAIDAMLTADLDAPRKQRHTAKRVFARLVEEHGAVDVSYWTVRDYVARRRPEIRAEAGVVQEGFVPQSPEPGAQAEVDFADVWVELAGVVTKCHLFTFRMSCSGKAVHRVHATQGQEAFFEGHVTAFDVLGGVPVEHIRYDNLKPAVHRVCFGRNRLESDRFVLLCSHYLGVAVDPRRQGEAGVERLGRCRSQQRAFHGEVLPDTRWPGLDPAAVLGGVDRGEPGVELG